MAPASSVISSILSASQRKSSSGRSPKTENFFTSPMMCSSWVVFSVSAISHRAQILMNELYCVRALSHAGCHTLHGTISNIASYENSWYACFEQPGVAVERPVFGALAVRHEVRPRQDKSFFFAQQNAGEPVRARRGANEYK